MKGFLQASQNLEIFIFEATEEDREKKIRKDISANRKKTEANNTQFQTGSFTPFSDRR